MDWCVVKKKRRGGSVKIKKLVVVVNDGEELDERILLGSKWVDCFRRWDAVGLGWALRSIVWL
jgi:hypothetical protein